ncbi:MAG: sulfate transporter CysZ [Gammaproteobacteria bacterium]|nr:sulfate transporter CysZ [Gammaproteobacteria bacterium]
MIAGIQIFLDGARLAGNRQLGRYTWIPVLIAVVVITIGLSLTLGYLKEFSSYLVALLPEWLDFLDVVLTPLLYALGLLIGAWLLSLLAVVIASPFLGDLSIQVERLRYADAPANTGGVWRGAASSLRREARKLGYHLPRLVGVFLITLIPVINALSPVVWFGFGAWTMAVQFADYPAENRGLPFIQTLEHLRRNRVTALGFGACVTLALAIPLLNIMVIPVAVAGGTILWRSKQRVAPQSQVRSSQRRNTIAAHRTRLRMSASAAAKYVSAAARRTFFTTCC